MIETESSQSHEKTSPSPKQQQLRNNKGCSGIGPYDYDDRSIRSTISVHESVNKLKTPKKPGSKSVLRVTRSLYKSPLRRKVRFNERHNRSYPREYEEGDKQCTWYTAADYDQFRFEMERQVRRVQWQVIMERQEGQKRRHDKYQENNRHEGALFFSDSLMYLIQLAANVNYELENVSKIILQNEAVRDIMGKLYKRQEKDTDLGCCAPGQALSEAKAKSNSPNNASGTDQESGFDWIGLEYYMIPGVKQESKERRCWIQEVVSDIQSEYRKGLWTRDTVEQELRDCCCQVSQTHTLFAQFVAQAQYMSSMIDK